MRKKNLIFISLICLVLLALHYPFLKADPHLQLSIGRDANTDEGLYSYQVRNFIHHGDLTLRSSDCLLKTPLFGLILFPVLKIFGTEIVVARVCVLILTLFACFVAFSQHEFFTRLGFASLIFILPEYYIFHYFHYSMADTLSTISIFLGIVFLVKPYRENQGFGNLFLSATFISISYYIKIQYLYILLLIPLAICLQIVTGEGNRKSLFRKAIYLAVFLVSYLLIYIVCWYWPNAEFFSYVLGEQTASRFPEGNFFYNQVNNNIRFIFLNGYLRIYLYAFALLGLFGIYRFFKSDSALYRNTFIAISCWILLESHKLSMTYLPSRYLVSLLFAMGLMIALISNELLIIKLKRGRMVLISLFVLLCAVFLFKNGKDYIHAYRSRTWSIQEADNYLAQFEFDRKPIAGAWATALAWKSGAYTFPVWNKYFNDSSVIEIHSPVMIISESDEGDSGNAFSSHGINLVEKGGFDKIFYS